MIPQDIERGMAKFLEVVDDEAVKQALIVLVERQDSIKEKLNADDSEELRPLRLFLDSFEMMK